jgi:hypothetical protein
MPFASGLAVISLQKQIILSFQYLHLQPQVFELHGKPEQGYQTLDEPAKLLHGISPLEWLWRNFGKYKQQKNHDQECNFRNLFA